jgi:PAS domain S-box-containing protein
MPNSNRNFERPSSRRQGVRTQRVPRADDRYRRLFEKAAVGMSRQSLDGVFLEVNEKACEIYGRSRDELVGKHFTFNFHPDDIDRALEWACAMVEHGEQSCCLDNRIILPDGSIVFIRTNVAHGDDCFIVVVEDITEQRAAEERQKLLTDELNHRVKNTLATVQSISMQTLRSVENDPKEFRTRFQKRLLSLSLAHDLLTQSQWEGADLGEIIALTLAPYLSSNGSSIVMQGDPVHLSANAAVTLNMVFHELATNAAKYGSLSVANGHLDISWRYDDIKKPTSVFVSWTESGGPEVSPPTRAGFGTRMIQLGPTTELWAKCDLAFDPKGVQFTLDIPLSNKVMVPKPVRKSPTRNRRAPPPARKS